MIAAPGNDWERQVTQALTLPALTDEDAIVVRSRDVLSPIACGHCTGPPVLCDPSEAPTLRGVQSVGPAESV